VARRRIARPRQRDGHGRPREDQVRHLAEHEMLDAAVREPERRDGRRDVAEAVEPVDHQSAARGQREDA
jgi:hypothetical protein